MPENLATTETTKPPRELEIRRAATVRDAISTIQQMETALTGGKRLSAFEREALVGKLEAAIYDLDKLLVSGELIIAAAEKRGGRSRREAARHLSTLSRGSDTHAC
jgi:hypothetical protein